MKKHGLKRLLALLLCAVCLCGVFPSQAFAASVGQKASSWLGGQYVGSDGQHYYSPAPYTYLVYNSDGTMDVRTSSGGSAYRHYMLTASDGSSQQVYCVESGIAYNASDNTYTSESGTNSNYLNLLPSEARRGITLTAIYGWKPGASLPVSGINEDDYKMATQIILWEYQQQLRSDPYSRHGNGHADANQYFSVISGRPAEKAYNWILSQVASHSTVPSFTSTKKSGAPELELKWDTEKKIYTLTVTDTNNLKINLETLKGSGVSVTRNGNKYTFTSKNMIMDPVTFEFRKDIPVANDMLIWGRPGYQTMMTGASDPVSFFVKIKTETYGTAKIVKTSEDGIVSGIPDFTVFISSNGQTYSYILNNRTITARLRVEKCDAETGNIIPMTGTGFQIKDLSTGEFVTQDIYYPNPETLDTFYVSDEGWLMLPEPLHTGDYELYEVAAPYGYVLSSEPVPFTIDGSEAVVTVTQYNMPQKGQLTITKTGEVFASVQENDGLYQPVYEVMGLPGAVYDVIADEDIYTGDGTLRAAKDTVVETLTTGEDGTAQSGLLYLGRYRLEERQAPEGMVLNTQPEYAELTYAGETVEVTQTAIGLYDERQKVDVSLFKALETDDLFGLGMNEEYKDISFGLYASADLTALDGSVIPAGGLLEVVSVDPNEAGGYDASFASDLPFGSYYVKECTTNNAYILSDTEYPVVFEYAGQEAALVQILVNEGEVVSNDLLRGRVDGVKVGENPEGGEDVKLSGALMGLFRPDTEEFTGENALLTVTTAEDGSFSFENIPYGHWIVKEISSPALYTVSPEQHHIYIGVDGQRIEIKVENTLIRGSVQVMKTEAVDEPSSVKKEDKDNKDNNTFLRFLYGAVFDLYEDANGNKEFDSEDTKIGTLKESDAGYHTAEGLLAKGYFVKESKAPEGYQLDENAYYFAITEDGQVAVVENGEAGRGFTNEAYRGNLKITKDSSDGRKDGFAFEVKSADGSYCETFTSPKSGVIEVKGLRVGIYTVTEISNRASRDYIIPDAATVEIKADETATVQFFNEKPEKPKTPDNPDNPKTPSNPSTPSNPDKAVPQTGDDNFIFLYGGLLALAVIGGGLFAAAYFKKGKYSRNTPKRKAVGIAAVSLCGLLALGSGFLMVRDLNQYSESAGAYEDIASHVELPEQTEAPEDDNTETDPAGADPSVVLPTVDFEALRETSPDIIGWLALPDTAINYPVTQTDDNEYYLHHLYDGTYNKTGCLFTDYENQEDFSDRNTIIYGHNMRDGSMFAALNEYDEQSYFDGHPQMYLVTPGGGYVVEIFTAFVAKPSESGSGTSPWRLSFKDDGAYTTWLSEMAGRSVIETDVTATSSDKVLTLSTCMPGGASRFIVMGKLAAVND